MQSREIQSKSETQKSIIHRNRFSVVKDSRNRKVRGLWMRNSKYYCQMWVKGEASPRRIRLKEATNLEEAKVSMRTLHTQREEGELPNRGHKPMFPDYVEYYLKLLEDSQANQKHENAFHKSPSTISKEREILSKWAGHIGQVRIDRVTRPIIVSYIDKRLVMGRNPRTTNIDLIVLRNLFKKAQDDGHLKRLPTEGIKRKKESPKKRTLLTPAQIENLFNAAKEAGKNGLELYDYLRFLAFSGCREREALRMKWEDVNFEREQITIQFSKNREPRTVEFNSQLTSLLKEMYARCAPDSAYLFPSPQRGNVDRPSKTFRVSFRMARDKAALPEAGFHDLRHYFASICVMNGIDFMTIAAWVGHKDGGILIGKVYGHLLDEHRRRMATKVDLKIQS